jgi:hypothetical protein
MSFIVWAGIANHSRALVAQCKPITNTAWVRARLCKLQKGALVFYLHVIVHFDKLLMALYP